MMADTPKQPRAIMLVDFQEEITPTGRKLLHCIFQDRYGDRTYRWTSPWRDKDKQHGVERLFLKALEVEEWNDPQGPWDEELKKAAEEVPLLKELRLPVRVQCGPLATVAEEGWAYRFQVSITGEEGGPVSYDGQTDSFWIENCQIHYQQFKQDFLGHFKGKRRIGVSERVGGIWEDGYDPRCLGVSFSVWLPRGLERQDYRIIGREVASFVRSYLRRVLGDYESLKRGFED